MFSIALFRWYFTFLWSNVTLELISLKANSRLMYPTYLLNKIEIIRSEV